MERTVPSTASDEIDLYIRTIYSLLRSTTPVQIRTLEEVHTATASLLHSDARSESPDTSAFIYSLLRLPECMPSIRLVALGQSVSVFVNNGFENVELWEEVSARARRRRCLFDGKDTLACFIASRSDIDDVIPTLTAFQIEWNKIHLLLRKCPNELIISAAPEKEDLFLRLSNWLQMKVEDLNRLWVILGEKFADYLLTIQKGRMEIGIHLLNGSLTEYWRSTRTWLDNIESNEPLLTRQPVYFISSNPHSPANLLTGFALQHEIELVDFLGKSENSDMLEEWNAIQAKELPSNYGNFLYYVLKKYQQTDRGQYLVEEQKQYEKRCGIKRIPSMHAFDIESQVIELNKIIPESVDPRLRLGSLDFLKNSDALILNIDYPLGLAAYNILAKVAEHAGPILGVYVMGKAATLNGVRGDVMIPTVIQDEHSRNTYLFQNAFNSGDVIPYLVYGTVMDNQKGVSVLGTFLQNARIMDVMYREGYTDIEMEAGPYLSAVYEMYRPKRHPVNELVNLYGVPFDIGIIHYASDTPLGKGKNLGAGTLSYFGMDSTYASTIAVLRRIFENERKRLLE